MIDEGWQLRSDDFPSFPGTCHNGVKIFMNSHPNNCNIKYLTMQFLAMDKGKKSREIINVYEKFIYNYKLDLAPIVYVRAPVSPWAPCLSIDHPVFLFLGKGNIVRKGEDIPQRDGRENSQWLHRQKHCD